MIRHRFYLSTTCTNFSPQRDLKKSIKNSIGIGRSRSLSYVPQMAFRRLIGHEKLAHNKKSNLETHFLTKHTKFASKYPAVEARKKAVNELGKKKKSSSILSNWA
ncbi:uncharacterized protein TNCV_339361 [Trichonephila clavipes]|nr:uncharacterized protein TNCV_339361 [Trichonephila clavipes]